MNRLTLKKYSLLDFLIVNRLTLKKYSLLDFLKSFLKVTQLIWNLAFNKLTKAQNFSRGNLHVNELQLKKNLAEWKAGVSQRQGYWMPSVNLWHSAGVPYLCETPAFHFMSKINACIIGWTRSNQITVTLVSTKYFMRLPGNPSSK